MPSEAQFGVQTALRLKSKKLKATGIYPEKQKTQEFIRKNKKHRNLSGKTKNTGIHRGKQQSFHRHSHESGNLDPSARKLIFRHLHPT
ncbi:ubiquitin-activating enzyme [Neisseria meningitidis]|uniref:ubiquitin-activating enzyme n=1 Tax=Neisseria meningitidis TaxID=487 RepID=UPI000B2DA673|nr:ubiquitin-activating enzyme [Neisseria meningitidis]MCL5002506.1 ubiquitin-activating enzyme [Neisseria meningitidis]MCL5910140.1 ubiquitin-activating enzyme [Neisseria meningitidis]